MTNYNNFDEKSLKNLQTSCLFHKSDVKKKKKLPAGLHHTEVRIGDAPNPPFPMGTN